jgi:cellulose synthase/poly-beta-1,6-N-acetylglucosamine synthase-like glycosyltransferase
MLEILEALFVLITFVMMVYLARHYIFTVTVLRKAKKAGSDNSVFVAEYEPTVSVLIPAHNEEHVIEKLLQRMTELTYPRQKMQVIVIDDASSDGTKRIAQEFAAQCSFIQVLSREQEVGGRGKASALNAGLKLATGEIVLCFDADYYPQIDIVEKLVQKFTDKAVGAVQGRPVVLNESQSMVTRLVTLERIGGFRVDQQARDSLDLIPQFGGTVGGFRRSILEQLGGFDESMLTEDTDLTFHIYLLGYKIAYAGDAECYEEAVNTLKAYWKQRNRWARGHMQVCFKHSINVIKSKKLSLKEKIDGLLLLHVYFMPVITMLAFFLGAFLILYGSSSLVYPLWFFVPISLYSCVGNFAPFFEVGIGAYLDGRTRLQWLVPLLIFAYLYNIAICTKAFLDLIAAKILRRKQVDWQKTKHLGEGKRYIESKSILPKRL